MTRRYVAVASVALVAISLVSSAASSIRRGDARTRLIVLGTGTPNADPDRSGPAVAIVVDGRAYLVDAGPGVVRRAAAASRLHHLPGLAAESLAIVFVTHLHSDHTLGLPDLMFSPWTLGRTKPLEVYGPRGIAAMVDRVREAYREDVALRLDGLEPANTTGHATRATEIDSGLIYRDARVSVRAFRVPHGSWRHALGYRFETRERTIVVSGDTGPGEAVVRACSGCDVLVHEVYSAERFASRPADWRRYHASFHTSAVELGAIATRARPGLLVLYHQLFWGTTDDALEAEVRRHYTGRVRSARDLDAY